MRERRKAISDCYICGTALARVGPNGQPVALTDEHVIPKGLLSRIPVPEPSRVPLILPVHKACEEVHKKPNEQLTLLLLRFFALDDNDYAMRDIGTLRSKTRAEPCEEPGFHSSHLIVPAGTEKLLQIWMRGLFAVLYGESLPDVVEAHASLPVPALKELKDGEKGVSSIEHWSLMRDFIVTNVRWASTCGAVDELEAWGGQIRFKTTWRHVPQNGRRPWFGCWTLEMPGYNAWSTRVLGYPSPWHGLLCLERQPDQAAVFTEEQAIRWAKVTERRKRAGLE